MKHWVDGRNTSNALLALAGLVASGGGGCDEFGPRVYTAQRYRSDIGCLESYAPLGLVQAEELGAGCEAVCLALQSELFVSTVCPPYPAAADTPALDSEPCAAALAAPSCDEASSSDAGPDAAGAADAAAL